ncbi:PepSY domain-containing protein [Sporosarcina highlanderae]|uniref:PepSY domain-containing protein n=1 Tax=Sporosarcina highlanderae TaxID=3035916 RepID=A0ABT8JM98_9BACL|nr:PepSY domain-containing protein [Sporosarcina highlanderae]MDN4606195.1 PepSY domain-containing protein [Sporosarcina highlanderae]
MDIWKKPWFIPIVLTIAIVIAGQLYTSGKLTKAETLTKQEIQSQLETIYKGAVSKIVLDGSLYHAKIVRDGSEYAVKVEADTGKVLSLIQTKETTQSDLVVNDEQTPEEKPSTPANEKKTVLISEKQAAHIGMSQLPLGMSGEVDDIDFVKTTDGGYYLVQINIDTEDDLDEVTYQIHAISGKVLTVTWDD